MATTLAHIQLRRKTAAAWTAGNEVLLSGEQGVETDTGKHKLGNGTTAWNALPYQAPDATTLAGLYVPLALPAGVPAGARRVYEVTTTEGTTLYDETGTVL